MRPLTRSISGSLEMLTSCVSILAEACCSGDSTISSLLGLVSLGVEDGSVEALGLLHPADKKIANNKAKRKLVFTDLLLQRLPAAQCFAGTPPFLVPRPVPRPAVPVRRPATGADPCHLRRTRL